MSRKIAIVNRKGGVGKTALTANLGHALALAGHSVALVDLDPQGHLSTSFGSANPVGGMDSVLLEETPMTSVAVTVRERVDLFPAGQQLSEAEQRGNSGASRAMAFKECSTDALAQYDYTLIDCPPSVGILMSSALLAADEVITPVTGDFLALEGLSCITRALQQINQAMGRSAQHWVALSRIDYRRRITQDVIDRVRQHFPNTVLPTVIRESAVLAECPGFGQTIFEHRSSCRAAQEFALLADDIAQRRAA